MKREAFTRELIGSISSDSGSWLNLDGFSLMAISCFCYAASLGLLVIRELLK